jgi:excinuclease ABC subunit C
MGIARTGERFDHRAFLKTVSNRPGVYRMLDAVGAVLYVGKARDLKKRLASYFTHRYATPKHHALVAALCDIQVTVTRTEGEALLLENNLIKDLKPRYNILLRDDKSYPYIYVSDHEDFPRIGFYRGARGGPGRYFGPYPNAGAVRESLALMQKLFLVRQCEDGFFRNRTRPCLQYQIKRCTAPCVGYIDKQAYQADVRHAIMFLEGKNREVIRELGIRMEDASAALDYERAAAYRDQIARLHRMQDKQYVSGDGGDADVIASVVRGGVGCVQVFYIRGGRNLGNKSFFPRQTDNTDAAEILAAFLPQYYLGKEVPREIVVSHTPDDATLLEQVLGQEAGHPVTITHPARGEKVQWLRMAVTNGDIELARHLASQDNLRRRFELLQDALSLDNLPQRLECFDISHTGGGATVASCVVFSMDGPRKGDYRRFNIEGITPGDDYAAMRQALSRHYSKLKRGEGTPPDILFIDGGKGQVGQAESVMEELQINGVTLVGVAKGPARKPGMETLFISGLAKPIQLKSDSPALHLIQQLRDEAHRFAITGHRRRRAKAQTSSVLEDIPGVGPQRRRQLLKQFGGLREVARAGVEELAKVQGISRELAARIYSAFHDRDK